MGFINEQSFKCLLGPRATNLRIHEGLFSWTVGKKNDFSTSRLLVEEDLDHIRSISPASFHYLSLANVEFLQKHFKVSKTKQICTNLDITDLSLSGGNLKNVRQSYNKCAKNKLEVFDNFKDIKDIADLIEEWSNEYTDKYFRDFSGKNMFFYKNNFHKDCVNAFVYSGDHLVAFGSLSAPINRTSSYIIGKALFKRMPGLSEFADISLYQKIQKDADVINMGRGQKKLLFYKSKFPGSTTEIEYDGSIE